MIFWFQIGNWYCVLPPPSTRTVTICGGTRSPRSFLRMTPCSPSPSVWKTDPNDTVRTSGGFRPSSCFSLRSRVLRPGDRYVLTRSTQSRASAAIGRTLIPRYFRSIFEGGATELFYVLKHPKESFHSNFVSLDCDQCTMVTQNGKPMFTQVLFPRTPDDVASNLLLLSFSYLIFTCCVFLSGAGVRGGPSVPRVHV